MLVDSASEEDGDYISMGKNQQVYKKVNENMQENYSLDSQSHRQIQMQKMNEKDAALKELRAMLSQANSEIQWEKALHLKLQEWIKEMEVKCETLERVRDQMGEVI